MYYVLYIPCANNFLEKIMFLWMKHRFSWEYLSYIIFNTIVVTTIFSCTKEKLCTDKLFLLPDVQSLHLAKHREPLVLKRLLIVLGFLFVAFQQFLPFTSVNALKNEMSEL